MYPNLKREYKSYVQFATMFSKIHPRFLINERAMKVFIYWIEVRLPFVSDTMSTPCLAWFRACTIESSVDLASCSSYTLVR
jgi:hypothetical protein